jgi:homoserine dehydrogenase
MKRVIIQGASASDEVTAVGIIGDMLMILTHVVIIEVG